MALKTATATFTGVEESIDVIWSGVGASHHVSVGVSPSDGFGAIQPWLTNHTAGGATINVSGLWQGKVKLTIVDAPSLAPWPAAPVLHAWRSSTPIPANVSGPVGVTRVYTFPVPLPSDVTSVGLKGCNRTFFAAAGADATLNVNFCASDGTGLPTGSPTAALTGVVLPGNGTVPSATAANVTRGSDGKAVMLHTFPDPTFVYASGCDNGYFSSGTSTLNPPPASSGGSPNPNFWWTFGYQTAKKRVAVAADSINGGYSPDNSVGFQQAAFNQLAFSQDWAVNIESIVLYGSLQTFADFAGHPYLWDQLDDILGPGVSFAIPLGTNDLGYNTLAPMQTYLQAIIAHVVALGVTKIVPWTVPPASAGYPGTDTVRTNYNTWLKANYLSLGCTGVYDAAAAQSSGGLAANGNPNAMAASLVTSDLTHPNIAGQTVIAAGFLPLL